MQTESVKRERKSYVCYITIALGFVPGNTFKHLCDWLTRAHDFFQPIVEHCKCITMLRRTVRKIAHPISQPVVVLLLTGRRNSLFILIGSVDKVARVTLTNTKLARTKWHVKVWTKQTFGSFGRSSFFLSLVKRPLNR